MSGQHDMSEMSDEDDIAIDLDPAEWAFCGACFGVLFTVPLMAVMAGLIALWRSR